MDEMSWKGAIFFLIVLIVLAVPILILYKFYPTSYVSNPTVGGIASDSNPANVTNAVVTINGVKYTVEERDEIYPVLGQSPILMISFKDAVDTAINASSMYDVVQVRLLYLNGDPVYIVRGVAYDNYVGYSVDNWRVVTINAENGNVMSVSKELLFVSYVRTSVDNVFKDLRDRMSVFFPK